MHSLLVDQLVTTASVTDLISVQSRAASATKRANRSTLLATNQTTDEGATASTHRPRELVTMLLPETAASGLLIVVINSARARGSTRITAARVSIGYSGLTVLKAGGIDSCRASLARSEAISESALVGALFRRRIELGRNELFPPRGICLVLQILCISAGHSGLCGLRLGGRLAFRVHYKRTH